MTRCQSSPGRATAALLTAALAGCGGGDGERGAGAHAALFRDITDRVGVDFAHHVELTGSFPLPEITGSGCAVFDADGDGRLDLYFSDAGRCGGRGAPNRLYRQLEDGTFRDVTATSGLGDTGYGMGVAVGDLDNDGDLDVYVGNDGPDALYFNDGDGTFTDVTARAGITGREWTSSVAILDYDNDGYLDVYVVHYVAYDPERLCTNDRSRRDYCDPRAFAGLPDRLYRNRGDGTFDDVSAEAGIAAAASNGLGVIVDDFDDDGWPDVFVANDGEANHLWINNRDRTFREDGLIMGVAVNAHGAPEASMGVAAGDVDHDGDLDLFMTHLLKESHTLYLREEFGFVDGTTRTGLTEPSLRMTGFGTALFDIEHDGDLDLVIANGRVEQGPVDPRAAVDPLWSRYAEPNQIFLNQSGGRFTEVTGPAQPFCEAVEVTRGLAAADLDDDGDLDLVITNCRGPARVYENVAARAGHWLAVRAMDGELRRDVYGAVVFVSAGGRVHRRTVAPQTSYLTSSTVALHFGLGTAAHVDGIRVRWPGGQTEAFPGGAVDRSLTIVRGEGSR